MDIVACCVGSVYKVDSEFSDAQPMLCMLRWFLVDLWVCALWLWVYLHQLWVSSHHVGLTICGVVVGLVTSVLGFLASCGPNNLWGGCGFTIYEFMWDHVRSVSGEVRIGRGRVRSVRSSTGHVRSV